MEEMLNKDQKLIMHESTKSLIWNNGVKASEKNRRSRHVQIPSHLHFLFSKTENRVNHTPHSTHDKDF